MRKGGGERPGGSSSSFGGKVFHQVENTIASFHWRFSLNGEVSSEGLLECIGVVLVKGIPSVSQEALYLWVSLGDKLDEEPPAEASEPFGKSGKWDVIGEGQMVDEGEGKCQVGGSALKPGEAFPVSPTQGWAGIGEIHAEREQVGLIAQDAFQIVSLDAIGVSIERDCPYTP